MPRYWICSRCGTYNTEELCETCGLSKTEATQFEEIRERDPFEELYEDEVEEQEDWFITTILDEEEDWDEWNDESIL